MAQQSYTLEELQKMGATPIDEPQSYTLDDLQKMGATPVGQPAAQPSGETEPILSMGGIDPFGQSNAVIGAAKSAGRTALGLGRLVPGLRSLLPEQTPGFLQPTTNSQKAGGAVEQISEFLAPGAIASKIPRAGTVAKIGAESLMTGALSKGQGQSNEQAVMNMAIGAAAPALTRGAEKVQTFITSRMSSRSLNSLMGVNAKELERGLNPGEQIAKEGIVATSKELLYVKLNRLRDSVGRAIDLMVAKGGAGKTINGVEDMIAKPLENAVKGVGPGSEAAFHAQLSERLGGIMRVAEDLGLDLSQPLTPLQVNMLKREIGKGIKWSGAAYENEINQALHEVYSNLNGAVDNAVPGVRAMNARWANINSAANATEHSASVKGVTGLMPTSIRDALQRTIGSTPSTTVASYAATRGLGAARPMIRGGAAGSMPSGQ